MENMIWYMIQKIWYKWGSETSFWAGRRPAKKLVVLIAWCMVWIIATSIHIICRQNIYKCYRSSNVLFLLRAASHLFISHEGEHVASYASLHFLSRGGDERIKAKTSWGNNTELREAIKTKLRILNIFQKGVGGLQFNQTFYQIEVWTCMYGG